MIIDRKTLQETKMPELKQLIVQLKGDPSQPGETKESLIDRILFQAAIEPSAQEDFNDPHADDAPVQKVTCTVEEVKHAVRNFTARGMKFFHNPEDNTWLFRVRIKDATIRDTNSGTIAVVERWRDDSGTMNQPLNTIKRCASILMQGALQAAKPVQQKDPSNQYTEVV